MTIFAYGCNSISVCCSRRMNMKLKARVGFLLRWLLSKILTNTWERMLQLIYCNIYHCRNTQCEMQLIHNMTQWHEYFSNRKLTFFSQYQNIISTKWLHTHACIAKCMIPTNLCAINSSGNVQILFGRFHKILVKAFVFEEFSLKYSHAR